MFWTDLELNNSKIGLIRKDSLQVNNLTELKKKE